MPVNGQDEVAELSGRFNDAAERIEHLLAAQNALLASQKSLLASRLDAQDADIRVPRSRWTGSARAPKNAPVGAVLHLPEGVPEIEMPGVAKRLRRMVRNLLENAKPYGGEAELGIVWL